MKSLDKFRFKAKKCSYVGRYEQENIIRVVTGIIQLARLYEVLH